MAYEIQFVLGKTEESLIAYSDIVHLSVLASRLGFKLSCVCDGSDESFLHLQAKLAQESISIVLMDFNLSAPSVTLLVCAVPGIHCSATILHLLRFSTSTLYRSSSSSHLSL